MLITPHFPTRRALKLRYLLPLIPPASENTITASASAPGLSHSRSPSKELTPTKHKFPASATLEPPLEFEAKIIASKSDGWEDMLEAAALRRVGRVVDEKRGER